VIPQSIRSGRQLLEQRQHVLERRVEAVVWRRQPQFELELEETAAGKSDGGVEKRGCHVA